MNEVKRVLFRVGVTLCMAVIAGVSVPDTRSWLAALLGLGLGVGINLDLFCQEQRQR